MITVEHCRRIMPEATKNLSDEEVAVLCRSYELLADVAVEVMLREKIPYPKKQNE